METSVLDSLQKGFKKCVGNLVGNSGSETGKGAASVNMNAEQYVWM